MAIPFLSTVAGWFGEWGFVKIADHSVNKVRVLFNPYLKLFGVDSLSEEFKVYYGRLQLDILTDKKELHITRDVRHDPDYGQVVFDGVIPPFGDIMEPPSGIPLPFGTTPVQLRVITAYKTDTGMRICGPKKLMGENEAFVASYVWASLLQAGYKKEISLYPGKMSLDEGSNFSFFTIGGPAANAVSMQLLSSFDTNVRFSTDMGSIETPDTNYTIQGNNDYAILAKVNNKMSNHPKKFFKSFIAAGLGEIGTQGAGRFLYTNAKTLVSKFGQGNFELVLRVSAKTFADTEIVYENKLV